jgi:CRP-like cAMP-binding protein
VGDRFYILASGRTGVTAGGEQRSDLGPGESFGEIALIRNVPRTASVVAIGPVELFALDRDAFCGAVSGDLRSTSAAEEVVERRLAETGHSPGG